MPHDRFYGNAAAELSEQKPDRDLFARAYALALGDPEKTKAIYIGIRAARLEEEAIAAAAREAEIKKSYLQQERERAKRKSSHLEASSPLKFAEPPSDTASIFNENEIAKAVQAMREALAASRFGRG